MNKKQKRILIISIVLVVIVIIAIVAKSKGKNKEVGSIVDNSIKATTITKEDRVENAIKNVITKIENAGMTAIKKDAITLGEAQGYNYSIEGNTLGIYYLDPIKMAQLVEKDSNSGQAKITIEGQTRNALVYNNVFILNCNSETLIEKLNNALGINNRM